MTITPLSTVYANGDTFSASDINATNTAVNLVTATQSLIASKGDILAGTADDTLGKTTVGANDTILTADSAQTNGVKWSATFTGSSGSCTGNSATATALQTARTIGGVSFDGTANINLAGVNTTGNQNTTGSSASCTGNSATVTTNANLTGDVTSIGNATTIGNGKVIGRYIKKSINSFSGATYSVVDADCILNHTGSSNTVVTLPSASTYEGRSLQLRNTVAFIISSATNNIVGLFTANTPRQVLGVNLILSATDGAWCELVSNGTDWVIVNASETN